MFLILIIGIPLLIKSIKELNQGAFKMQVNLGGNLTQRLNVGMEKVIFKRKRFIVISEKIFFIEISFFYFFDKTL